MKLFGGPPSRWICHGGRPAEAARNMPSFVHEDGELEVWDLLVALLSGDGELRLFSRWYNSACVLAPDGMVPLHHHEGAWWKWRPAVYDRRAWAHYRTAETTRLSIGFSAFSSQQELMWRHGLANMIHHQLAGEPLVGEEPDRRANALLHESLTPQQRLELRASHGARFRVRGAATKNLYRIDIGNGFAVLDKTTNEPILSYCFHPERYLPSADVALATKLALEDEDLEPEVLENANYITLPMELPRTRAMHHARDLEKELIA